MYDKMKIKEVSCLEKKIENRIALNKFFSYAIEPLGPAIVSIPKAIEITSVYLNNLIFSLNNYTLLIA